MKYETYVAQEVPDYIDDHYRTIKNRNARAIGGLSMGGHGALFLAFLRLAKSARRATIVDSLDVNVERTSSEEGIKAIP